ncbi:hypothetical protein M2T37_27615, partial [Klebsiella pneumoniae]|uniref:hypothetical protein n=1 Tax=Klebsiella pneumoniae TaxID=573 RepID=UPI002010B85E
PSHIDIRAPQNAIDFRDITEETKKFQSDFWKEICSDMLKKDDNTNFELLDRCSALWFKSESEAAYSFYGNCCMFNVEKENEEEEEEEATQVLRR